jgi:multiple sugar transport system permease protein
VLVVILVIPMLLGLFIATKSVTQTTVLNWVNASFVGLRNFVRVLNPNDSIGVTFYSSILTTFRYGVLSKFFHFFLGMIGALVVNRKFRGRLFFQTLFLIPLAIPSFISAIAWRFMFLKDWGLVNYLLVDVFRLLQERPFWLVGDNALAAVITAQVWKGWAFHYLMIFASLKGVPQELYESVEMDGGGRFLKFWHVTYQHLKPILKVLLVVNGLRILNEFDTVFVMIGQRPPASVSVISMQVYNQAFVNWNFGIASAMGAVWLVALVTMASVLAKTSGIYQAEKR